MYNKLLQRVRDAGFNVSDEFLEQIKANSELIFVGKNEKLIEIGTVHKYGYFILSGSFVRSVITDFGEQKAVWFYFDELFNMMISPDGYFTNNTTKYEIKAIENSRLIKFSKESVDSWIYEHAFFSQMYLEDIAQEFLILNDFWAYKLSHSTIQFIKYINSKYPIILNRVPAKHIAHFLGVSPEWYSKLKKRL
ncbi:MAG: hypothetical protein AAF741_12725 [Bacteroidota bacterium]